MAKTFKVYQDAGHGWLAVKRQLLEDLGLVRTITAFSYVNGKTVYLEEDQDAVVFKNAYEQRFGKLETKVIHHGDRSWIRNMKSFGHNVPIALDGSIVDLPPATDELNTIDTLTTVNVKNDF